MNGAIVAILAILCFAAGYFLYAEYLSDNIFALDPDETCPSQEFRDNVDYLPTDRHVLFGHHFCSITGAAPIVGPAVAVLWGWIPAVLWVVIGTIFIGAVHDFGTLVVSVRHKGRSISDICGDIVGERSRSLFLILVFTLIWVVIAVFAVVIATLFVKYKASVVPVNFEILVAIIIGTLLYRGENDLLIPSILALISLYAVIFLTVQTPILGNFDITWLLPFSLEHTTWMDTLGFHSLFMKKVFVWVLLLLLYSFIASVLPVWTLLQPRDFINGHQLFVGLGALYLGLLIAQPKIAAPGFNDKTDIPGAMGELSTSDGLSNFRRIPKGMLLIPEDQLPSSAKRSKTIPKIRNQSHLPRPRFYVVPEVSNPSSNSSFPIRAVKKQEGEGFSGSLIPVLNQDNQPWMYHESTQKISPGSSRMTETTTNQSSLKVQPDNPARSAPPIIPFLFITIACGAISGFHGLVSSGTTSKQLETMEDCRYIGYGGMVGEGLLGLMSVLAATAGFTVIAQQTGEDPTALWTAHYSSWGGANDFAAKIGAFVHGGGAFLGTILHPVLPESYDVKRLSEAIVAILVISFAATTLDSATRIQRFIFQELTRPLDYDWTENLYASGAIAAFTPLLLIFGGAWGALWPLFGATNQMLAGLSMLVITVYLVKKRKQIMSFFLPMIFLIIITGLGLFLLFLDFFQTGFLNSQLQSLPAFRASLTLVLFGVALWIVWEGIQNARSTA